MRTGVPPPLKHQHTTFIYCLSGFSFLFDDIEYREVIMSFTRQERVGRGEWIWTTDLWCQSLSRNSDHSISALPGWATPRPFCAAHDREFQLCDLLFDTGTLFWATWASTEVGLVIRFWTTSRYSISLYHTWYRECIFSILFENGEIDPSWRNNLLLWMAEPTGFEPVCTFFDPISTRT